jgi:outer membrane protein W
MKKLFLLAVVTVFAFSYVDAQNEDKHKFTEGWQQGNWYASGSLGFTSSKQGDDKDNFFVVMPQVGYFITEDIVVGLGVGYMSDKSESGSSEITENTFMVGPFAKWFCYPTQQFSPYIGAHVNYMSINNDNGSTDIKEDGFEIAATLGFNYWVSNCITLKAQYAALSYQTQKADVSGAEAQNTFSAGFNLKNISFGVGFRF